MVHMVTYWQRNVEEQIPIIWKLLRCKTEGVLPEHRCDR